MKEKRGGKRITETQTIARDASGKRELGHSLKYAPEKKYSMI